MTEKDAIASYITEMRRGTLVFAVLGCLRQPHYGYGLLQKMQDNGIAIEANTLYPLLRRLEKQALLTSTWDTTESRPRKFYKISPLGLQTAAVLKAEWQAMARGLAGIYQEDEK